MHRYVSAESHQLSEVFYHGDDYQVLALSLFFLFSLKKYL